MKRFDMSPEKIKPLLKSIDIFEGFSDEILEEICSNVEPLFVDIGTILVQNGDTGDCLYVIAVGQFRVLIHNAHHPEGKEVSRLSSGDLIGEMALLSTGKRSASVQASRPSQVLKILRKDFYHIIQKWPSVLLPISQMLVERLQASQQDKKPQIKTIALIPGQDAALIERFTDELAEKMTTEGSVLRLSSDELYEQLELAEDMELTEDVLFSIEVLELLQRKEEEYRFVLYETDREPSAWNHLCLAQADRILLLHAAKDSPECTEIEKRLFTSTDLHQYSIIEMYLLHEESDPIVGTAQWLENRKVALHHHVLLTEPLHYERAVRFLAGKAVGLVLGGGGARGGAAIGAIRALREKGIPIDMIGGNSIGAVVSGLWAAGHHEIPELLEKTTFFMHKLGSVASMTLPFFGLISGKKVDKTLSDLFGDTQIEDLWMNCFTVSTNLSTGAREMFCNGPLSRACRASASLPGIPEPLLIEGDVLVDGALVDNLPSDVMHERCYGHIILVDLMPPGGFTIPENKLPSKWRLIWEKINPFAKKSKWFAIDDIIMRAMCISNLAGREQAESFADLVLTPPITDYGMTDPNDVLLTSEVGYEYTVNEIKDIDIA